MFYLLTIGAFIAALVALGRIGKLQGRLNETRSLLRAVHEELEQLKSAVNRLKPEMVAEPDVKPAASRKRTAAKAAAAEAIVSEPEVPSQSEPKSDGEPEPALAAAAMPQMQEARTAGSSLKSIEQALAGRWFVVIGGIAIALGGLLFVKYAHDNGLIPPWLRVAFGYAFAGALVYGGEYVRKVRNAAISDYVPAALSAAGLVIAFGVTYAAYALYDLFSPGLCFPLLVANGLAALWLSRRQGPLIAALGLVGSYAAPALVPSDHPSAWGFFAYLLVIVVACFYELRDRPWWWLGFSAIGGALLWSLLWIHGGLYDASQLVPTGLFAFALALAATFIPRGLAALTEDYGTIAEGQLIKPPLQMALAGGTAGALVLASLVVTSRHATGALLFFAAGMTCISVYGWVRAHKNIAPLLAACLTFIVMILWRDVSTLYPAMDDQGFWTLVPGLVEPPRFVTWMLLAMAAFGLAGLAGTITKRQPPYWDVLAASSIPLFLFGAWGLADFTMGHAMWAMIAVAAAALLLAVSHLLKSRIAEPEIETAITLLVAASALTALFAADRLFDTVWYTIAIAALAAAYAAGSRLIPLRVFGIIAALLASFAAARLFIGREFWATPEGLPLGQHWPIYGYGVPAGLFWLASRLLIDPKDGKPRVSLEGLSLGLLISLVSLELRVLIGGGVTAHEFSLLELASHVVAWLGAAFGLAYRQKIYSGFISRWGTLALVGASCAMLVVMLLPNNPAFTQEAMQPGALINPLWLAYFIPAALLALIVNRDTLLGSAPYRQVIGGLALFSVIMFATLMVKRAYQGPVMVESFLSSAENYTVSLVWLLMSIAAFIGGMKIDRQYIRVAGLGIMALTVLKVFTYDFAELDGLWRIASLMGLGFSLVGIGWLYTRFVNKPTAAVSV